MRFFGWMCLAAFGGLSLPLAMQAQVKVDPKLPDYKAVGGVSGSLKSIGSDTMSNEMTYWAEGFSKFYPNIQREIESKGSGTAPPAVDRRDRQLRADEPADEGERNRQLQKAVWL